MEFLTCGLQGYEWIRQEGNDYRLLKKLILPEQKENVEGVSLRKLSIKEISEEAIPVFSDYPYLKELNCADNRLKQLILVQIYIWRFWIVVVMLYLSLICIQMSTCIR